MRRDVLWSATLGSATLDQRVAAAAANGYGGMTVRPDDLQRLREEGRSPAEVSARAADAGVATLILESLSEWHDHEPAPAGFPSAMFSVDDHLRAAEAFSSRHVTIVAAFRTAETVAGLTERFAAVCDRFADAGVAVHLEFTPFRPIPSLATAWQIVRDAGRPNGGILVDTWHFFQREPDLDLLATVPGDRIFSVQVNDGRPREYVESLVVDTFRHRLLPGTGSFDLAGVVRTLRATGGLNLMGPEVLSVELDALEPVEAARRAGEAFDRVLSLA